jgi:ABC-type transport system involved in multi-copper enzyme maturation permease subunit
MIPTLTIARNTFREAVRNRIFAVLIFFSLAMLALVLAVSSASLHEEVRLMKDVGLFLISTCAVVIAIFTGVTLVYKELERKTIYTVMPKPIYRAQFLAGKYLGLALTMLLLVTTMGGVLIAMLYLVEGDPGLEMVQALWLLYVEVLVVMAVALVFSSFSTPFLSGLLTLGTFVCGRFVDVMLTLHLGKPDERTPVTEAISAVVRFIAKVTPDLSLYNVTPHVVYARPLTAEFMLQATLTGIGYVGIGFVISAVLFSRRDFV